MALVTEDDRAYYREVWGFDPVADRRTVAGKFQYRAEFPLTCDPRLTAAGVQIAAEVTFTARGEVVNHIVFFKGRREAHINCTHTVIYSGTMDDALTLAQDGILSRFRTLGEQALFNRAGTAKLPPEEHFVALRSYVAAIAEAGIESLLGAGNPPAWDGHDLGMSQPFGFNAAMRTQVVAALREVAPTTAEAILRNVFAELVTTGGPTWFRSRLMLLDGLYFHYLMRNFVNNEFIWKAGMSAPFAQFLLDDPAFFEMIFEIAPLANLIRCAVHWPDTPPAVFLCIVTHARVEDWLEYPFPTQEDWADFPIQLGSESRLFLEMAHYYSKARIPADGGLNLRLLRVVPGAVNWFKKYRCTLGFWALHHPNLPVTALTMFARHPDAGLRALVTLNTQTSPTMLAELALDPDSHVRLGVACNTKTPHDALAMLAGDPDPGVQLAASHTAQR